MRRFILCLIAVSLSAGGRAWAAGGDDDKDKNVRSSDNSSPSGSKKPSETAKAGTDPGGDGRIGAGKPSAANPEVASELKELRQLVQEQADRLLGLQQRLAEVEGEVAAGKATTNTASSATAAGVTAAGATAAG